MPLKRADAEGLLKRAFPAYRIGERLGFGSYGTVFAVEGPIKGALRAVKFLEMSMDAGRDGDGTQRSASQRLTRDWRNIVEKYALLHACGEDVVKIIEISEEVLEDEDNTEDQAMGYGLVMMDRWPGNVKQFVFKNSLTREKRGQLFREVVGVTQRLHRRGLLFEDLKPQNVLVKRDGEDLRVCAGDIGGLKSIRSTSGGSKEATLSYASPEVQQGGRVDETALIFTLGLMGFLIFESRECYGEGDDPPLDLLARFAQLKSHGPDFGAGTDGEARELIGRCLQVGREQRLGTFAAVLGALDPAAARIRQVEEKSQRQLQEMAAKLAVAEQKANEAEQKAREAEVKAKADAETARKRAAEQALQKEKEATEQRQREIAANRQAREAEQRPQRPIKSPGPKLGDVWNDPVTGMAFLFIPGGKYMMGSNNVSDDEKPVHEVELDDFWLGKYPVTQGEWVKVMGGNPSDFPRGEGGVFGFGKKKPDNASRYPVESISWNDVQEFIKKLNAKGDGKFRLPWEAEWEYACRAGSTTQYCFGDDVGRLGDYAWYVGNAGRKTHPVGEKKPNDWGLYDMHGNVWEWCEDWYGGNYYANSPRKNPRGPDGGSSRVFRGGSWFSSPALVRSADRYNDDPGYRYSNLGLRLSRTCP